MPSRGLILVVEDDDGIRLSLRDFLKKRDYEVLVASDGVGALKLLLDYDIDLIISDFRMEILGGDYWVKFLKKFCADKKVLIASGFIHPEFSIPFEVFVKPFDYGELEARVAALLGAPPR